MVLALAQPAEPDCGRWGSDDLRTCEIDRTENDILDASGSVPAHQLGDGGIRFSSMPALGGDAYVAEFRPNNRGGARARFTWLYGHMGWRWMREGRWTFDISPTQFRDLTAVIESEMARIQPPREPPGPDDDEDIVVCTDGPGFLTEYVRGGQVTSMSGFCPYSMHGQPPNRIVEEHPNRMVEARVLDIICPRFRDEFNPADGLGRNCARRDRRLRSARR